MKTEKVTTVVGPEHSLIRQDIQRWQKNALLFLIPLAIVYLTSVTGIIDKQDHVFIAKDLVPDQKVIGAVLLYILNTLQDLYMKWSQETKYVA